MASSPEPEPEPERAAGGEPETGPEDDSFRPWKEFDSLDDYIGNSLAKE